MGTNIVQFPGTKSLTPTQAPDSPENPYPEFGDLVGYTEMYVPIEHLAVGMMIAKYKHRDNDAEALFRMVKLAFTKGLPSVYLEGTLLESLRDLVDVTDSRCKKFRKEFFDIRMDQILG